MTCQTWKATAVCTVEKEKQKGFERHFMRKSRLLVWKHIVCEVSSL